MSSAFKFRICGDMFKQTQVLFKIRLTNFVEDIFGIIKSCFNGVTVLIFFMLSWRLKSWNSWEVPTWNSNKFGALCFLAQWHFTSNWSVVQKLDYWTQYKVPAEQLFLWRAGLSFVARNIQFSQSIFCNDWWKCFNENDSTKFSGRSIKVVTTWP